MRTDSARFNMLFVLAGLVAALWLYPWLDEHRYQRLTTAPAAELIVTSPADSGPGTLRDALFRAMRSDVPTAIVLRASEIVVTTPLPPVVARAALRVRSDGEARTIRAAASLEAPVFDVRIGRFELDGVTIRGASSGYGVRTASAERVTLHRVTIADSDVGAGAVGDFELEITDSTFEGNRIGVEALGAGTTSVEASRFEDHDQAAVWAIGSTGERLDGGAVRVTGNRVEGGRFGVILGDLRAQVADNEISGFRADGILSIGGSVDITGNRIWNGRGAAIRSIGTQSGVVRRNDVHELGALGILVQSASSVTVDDNRVYRNGYGIVTVLNGTPASVELRNNLVLAQLADGLAIFGDAPLVAENRSVGNGSAGIRLFNLLAAASYLRASPLLVDNVLAENGFNEPVVSEYVMR